MNGELSAAADTRMYCNKANFVGPDRVDYVMISRSTSGSTRTTFANVYKEYKNQISPVIMFKSKHMNNAYKMKVQTVV